MNKAKIEFKQENVNYVLKNSQSNRVIVTGDGQIFEEKSKSYAISHAKSKGLDWSYANEKGLIQEESTEDKKSAKDSAKGNGKTAPTKAEIVAKSTDKLKKAQEYADAQQKALDAATDEKAKKSAQGKLDKALANVETAKTELAEAQAIEEETTEE